MRLTRTLTGTISFEFSFDELQAYLEKGGGDDRISQKLRKLAENRTDVYQQAYEQALERATKDCPSSPQLFAKCAVVFVDQDEAQTFMDAMDSDCDGVISSDPGAGTDEGSEGGSDEEAEDEVDGDEEDAGVAEQGDA